MELTTKEIRDRAYAARVPVSEVMKRAGVANSTFHRWVKSDGPKPHPVTLGKIEDALAAIEAEYADKAA